eukprot:m.11021 g.11021  ORF g.11021 m.11021 type:complete len:731 (-) comp4363_c0_seq1:187-2379(-)
MNLLEDSDEEQPIHLTVNKEYAARHTHNKKRDEKKQLEELYQDGEERETSSESEDEDAEKLTAEVEKDFFRTLSTLKSKNPKIYDGKTSFFRDPEEEGEKKVKTKKEKPVYLKDHERMRLETKGVMAFVSDDEDEPEGKASERNSRLLFDSEQQDIRKDVIKALHGSIGAEDNDDLLQVRSKSQTDLKAEEEDYEKWLEKEEALTDKRTRKELEPLRRFWTSDKLSDEDKFLRDFITKRRWRESEYLPTYDAITGGGKPEQQKDVDLTDDEEEVEKQEEFERKFNFRFEESDGAEIKSYPRDVHNSVRRKETKRQAARERAKDRKDEEKKKVAEEIQRLKKLKQEEILEKLNTIKEVTGTDISDLQKLDLEDEFDPAKHDEQMEQMFDEDYYEQGGSDEEKPIFPEDDDEMYDEYYDENYEEDEWPTVEPEEIDESAKSGKKRKLSKKEKKLNRKKLKEIETALEEGRVEELEADPRLKKHLEEYYNLEYEDVVGGIPTRFKYREVVPNDFGLSADEILKAEDKELNQWASLKKIVRYRDETIENKDKRMYKKRRKDIRAKKSVFALSEAWRAGETADEYEQRQKEFREAREAERKAKIIERRKQKKQKKGKDEGDEGEVKKDKTKRADDKEEDGKPKKNHKERRREARQALLKEKEAKEGSSDVKKEKPKSDSTPKETQSQPKEKKKEKTTKKKDSKKKSKTGGKPAPISVERMAAYLNSGKANLAKKK